MTRQAATRRGDDGRQVRLSPGQRIPTRTAPPGRPHLGAEPFAGDGPRRGATGAARLVPVQVLRDTGGMSDAANSTATATPGSVPTRTPLARAEIRALALASLGGVLEFYDFVIFVFFALVIGRLFFPAGQADWLRQVETFGLFAAGYGGRPLGGILMAHHGDRHGRKRVFTLSVLLMAIPTLLIGLLPTYAAIGPLAPLLLLALRILQGAAIGGEAPGGWVFVAEHAAAERVGLAVGLMTGGLTGGILLGSLTAALVNVWLTPAQVAAGWWRLPFLVGGLFGFAAMALRRRLEETPVFAALRSSTTAPRLPVRVVLREHGAAVLAAMASTWMLTAAIVVVILMTPALLQRWFAIPPRQALLANLLGSLSLCLSTVAVGAATDRLGLRRVAAPVLLLLVSGTYALYLGARSCPNALPLFYVLAGAGAGAVCLTPVLMVRAFPPAVRFSGVSLSYNVAYAAFGGVTPLLVVWMAGRDPLAPAHYVAGMAAVGLLATWLAPRPPAEAPMGARVRPR